MEVTITLPKYKKIFYDIYKNLRSRSHLNIPLTEESLCEKYKVSRGTIRKSLEELAKLGFIERKRKKGTFIKRQNFFKNLNVFKGFSELIREYGLIPSSVVLEQEVVPPNDIIRERLRIKKNELCIKIKRLRKANGEPLIIETSYLPHKMFPGLEKVDFSTASLYETLESKYNLQISHCNFNVSTRLATLSEKELLRIKEKRAVAVCEVEHVVFSLDNTPIEYTISIYNPQKFRFGGTIFR